jgi:hypothetical protein
MDPQQQGTYPATYPQAPPAYGYQSAVQSAQYQQSLNAYRQKQQMKSAKKQFKKEQKHTKKVLKYEKKEEKYHAKSEYRMAKAAAHQQKAQAHQAAYSNIAQQHGYPAPVPQTYQPYASVHMQQQVNSKLTE